MKYKRIDSRKIKEGKMLGAWVEKHFFHEKLRMLRKYGIIPRQKFFPRRVLKEKCLQKWGRP